MNIYFLLDNINLYIMNNEYKIIHFIDEINDVNFNEYAPEDQEILNTIKTFDYEKEDYDEFIANSSLDKNHILRLYEQFMEYCSDIYNKETIDTLINDNKNMMIKELKLLEEDPSREMKLMNEPVLLSYSVANDEAYYFDEEHNIVELTDEINDYVLFKGNGVIFVTNPFGRNLSHDLDEICQLCMISSVDGAITIGDFFLALGKKYDKLNDYFQDHDKEWYICSCQFYEGIYKDKQNVYFISWGS